MRKSASPLRVCFVANGRTPHGVTRAEALARAGNEVHFVTIGPVLETTLETHTTPLPRGPVGAVRSFLGFVRAIRKLRPDVLHLHYAGGRLGTLAHLACVHPFFVSVIGGDVLEEQHEGGLPPAERRATNVVLEDADRVLAKSERLREEVIARGVEPARVEVVRWGVDPEVFRFDPAGRDAMRARFAFGHEDRVVLSPRGLQPLYNIDIVVRGFAEARTSDPSLRLALTETGIDPKYVESIRGLIESLGVGPFVRFCGRFERAQLPAMYSAADVVINVPRSDGLPQSLFEAMACERPTILGDLPTYREIASSGEGVFYTAFEPGAVASALRDLVPRATDVGRRGRQRILEVADLGAEASRVSAMYRSACTGPRRSRRPSFAEAWSLLPRSL
jgi:glycosyltransferase involved in cell wall biosynthesis